MQYDEIITMVKEVSKMGLSSFEFSEGDLHLSMHFPKGRMEAERRTVPAERSSFETAAVPETEKGESSAGETVKSPLVGTFYAAPSEGSAPFVRKGDPVKKGQVLGIVEAMKLMNEIECEYDGVVGEILVENGTPVEYGQPLFRIM